MGGAEHVRRPVDISVALPVFNEENVLTHLYDRLAAVLTKTGLTYEIVFVDDGSTDATPRVLRRLADANPCVTVARLSRNWGHAAALKACLDIASGDSLVLMDADLQDEPELIPTLVAAAERESADVVYVVRSSRGEARWARGLFRVFHWAIARSSTFPLPRDAGSFGLLRPRALVEVRLLSERLRYFPGLRAFVGFRQVAVESPRGARYDGVSRVGFKGLVRLAAQAFFSQSRVPAMAFYCLSFVSLSASVGLVIYALTSRFVFGDAVVSWTSIVTALSLFSGVIILGLALVFEYLARIYEEVRGRPVYLVDFIQRGHAHEPSDLASAESMHR